MSKQELYLKDPRPLNTFLPQLPQSFVVHNVFRSWSLQVIVSGLIDIVRYHRDVCKSLCWVSLRFVSVFPQLLVLMALLIIM